MDPRMLFLLEGIANMAMQFGFGIVGAIAQVRAMEREGRVPTEEEWAAQSARRDELKSQIMSA